MTEPIASFIAAMAAIDDEAVAAMKVREQQALVVTNRINLKILDTLGTGLNYGDITNVESAGVPTSRDGSVAGGRAGVDSEGGGSSPASEPDSGVGVQPAEHGAAAPEA